MKPFLPGTRSRRPRPHRREAGSVLMIVLWVTFGLVSITLYFAQSTSLELRASHQRAAAVAAGQAATGMARYVTNVLATAYTEIPGALPQTTAYRAENLRLGETHCWLLGRPATDATDRPSFGLVDEGARLNLNRATVDMLQLLPRMTAEIAAAIVDWRDTDSDVSDGGAEDETYLRRTPSYHCKNGPFESVEELLLVQGMTPEILYGEDSNRNGVLDPNENDGDVSDPPDNRDGRLDPGLIEYLTVITRGPTLRSDGTAMVDVSSTDPQALTTLLQEKFGTERANAVLQNLGNITNGIPSVLEFYQRSGMSTDEFSQVEGDVTAAVAASGQVNINTAPEAVLAAVPGIGPELAPTIVLRRASNATGSAPTLAWLTEILDASQVVQAGPYVTARTYQVTADVIAVGPQGRGFRRIQWTCDLTDGTPRLVARRDLTRLGWPLGRQVRQQLLQERST